jgi:excisionase family DNA binding protein
MSDTVLQRIEKRFGPHVIVEEHPHHFVVKGYNRKFSVGGFQLSTRHNVLIDKQDGRSKLREVKIDIHSDTQSPFDSTQLQSVFDSYQKLEQKKRGKGRNPSTIETNDFAGKLLSLLQSSENTGLNQGILIGILQEMNEKILSLQKELGELAQDAVRPLDGDQILNVEEAMVFLGLKKSTIYSKVNRSEIPHMKRGKRLYFSLNELKDYLSGGKRLTQEELKESADRYFSK